MKLPEPARHAWLEHRNAVERIASPARRRGPVLLGGGTMLAARWKHRLSTDIDILLPDRDDVIDAHPGGQKDLAKATGGKVKEKHRERINVDVGGTMLDVRALKPQFTGLEKPSEIEGRNETVLATAQILRGKLNRTHRSLARDGFDLVTAAKTDPRALQHAVNALDETETLIATRNLARGNTRMAKTAPNALFGIAKKFETDLTELGRDAAAAVAEHRYTRVRIVLKDDVLIIERETSKGDEPPEKYRTEAIADALLESGIGEYLKANHRAHETLVAQGIAELAAQGRRGTVFDSVDADPAREISKAADSAMEREEKGLDEPTPRPQPATGEAERRSSRRRKGEGYDR